MQAGMSVLSETMQGFVLQPMIGENTPNVGPLNQYALELTRDRRGNQIAAGLKRFNYNEETMDLINAAANYCNALMTMETHAFSLVCSVYDYPAIRELNIPTVDLTDEEKAMTPEARIGKARSIMLGADYGQSKTLLIQNVSTANDLIQAAFTEKYAEESHQVSVFRTWIWVTIGAHAAISILMFFLFYHLLMTPLHNYSKHIENDQELDGNGYVKELNLVANAYNGLLDRRLNLENLLRSAAETDALTGLPNRYSLDCNLTEICEGNGSMTVLLFDVNYLKTINDTQGHLEGDRVIRDTGACIMEHFGEGNNCFRIGGDEFISILRGHTEQDVQNRIDLFQKAQAEKGISVSVGYAHTEDESDDSAFKTLLREADVRMYEKKKKLHASSDN